jgi:hypothetical protein
MGLSGEIGIHATLTHTPTTTPDLVAPSTAFNYFKAWTVTTGVGANQADRIWHDQRTIAASATDSLDLAGLLTDIYGVAFTLARLKALLVVSAAANVNNVHVTRPAANGVPLFLAAGDGIILRPGGAFCWFASEATGIVVTGGTGDLVDIINGAGGTSVVYDIVAIGASA